MHEQYILQLAEVVPEPEIQAPSSKERLHGVGDTRAAGIMYTYH